MAAIDLEGGGDDTDFEGEEAEGGAGVEAVGQKLRAGGDDINRNINRHPENKYARARGAWQRRARTHQFGCHHGLRSRDVAWQQHTVTWHMIPMHLQECPCWIACQIQARMIFSLQNQSAIASTTFWEGGSPATM